MAAIGWNAVRLLIASGLRQLQTVDAPGGGTLFVGTPTGGRWSLSVSG